MFKKQKINKIKKINIWLSQHSLLICQQYVCLAFFKLCLHVFEWFVDSTNIVELTLPLVMSMWTNREANSRSSL